MAVRLAVATLQKAVGLRYAGSRSGAQGQAGDLCHLPAWLAAAATNAHGYNSYNAAATGDEVDGLRPHTST